MTLGKGLRSQLRMGVILAGTLFPALLAFPSWGVAPTQSSTEGILSLVYESGLLSLQTRDAPIGKVLEEVARIAELTVTADGNLQGNLTVYIDKQPPDQAMRKILRGKDVTFLYARRAAGDPAGEFRLREVRIFLPETAKGGDGQFSYRPEPPPAHPGPRGRTGFRPMPPPEPPPADDESFQPASPPGPGPDAEKFLSGLMEGNFEALNEVAERIKEENPEAREQIDRFLENLEEAKQRAADGNPVPSLQGLGNLGVLMHEMMKRRD